MAEVLTLTAPITYPTLATWRVRTIAFDSDAPSIKIDFESNTGVRVVWRYVVDGAVTAEQVKAAISFINQGKFKTVQNKSLHRFLLEEAQSRGVLGPGTVGGSVE